jgi:hypothetical protein
MIPRLAAELLNVRSVGTYDPQCALVLAGGDGRRLGELTRRVVGDDRPKQFCPLLGRAVAVLPAL